MMGLRNRGAVAADVRSILLFVMLGRTAHQEGSWLGGVTAVAWPFLTGAAVAWAGLAITRRPLPDLRSGAVVLAGAVVLGMVLRRLAGGGVAPAFVLVATSVLGLLVLGWRFVVARLAARD